MNENRVENCKYLTDQEYKNFAPSQRHRAFTRLRISIMNIIYKISKLSKEMNIPYKGVALYPLQKTFYHCKISSHTIRDNVNKLVKSGFLKKTEDGRKMYYDFSDERFLCKDGIYILFDREFKMPELFALSCPRYPFCTLKEEDCGIGHYIEDFKKLFPNIIESLRKEKLGWNKIPVDINEWVLKEQNIVKTP